MTHQAHPRRPRPPRGGWPLGRWDPVILLGLAVAFGVIVGIIIGRAVS